MTVKVDLTGRIDSNNASQVEKALLEKLAGCEKEAVVLDASKLEYVSSAGLRVLLRLKKTYKDVSIVDVSSDVYEILEMTGFTEILNVEKAYKHISVEGCEVIGEGANGKVYRIDGDNVVKVYRDANALDEIKNEREVAKLALILGVPTAISYDIVKVGDTYGSVFEMLDARSFAGILADEPEKIDWCADEYVKLLKTIHSVEVPKGKLSDAKEQNLKRLANMKKEVSGETASKLEELFNDIPHSDMMIHGDYHIKNIQLAGDEVMIIDMDTLAVGHPIFELMQMYNAYCGFSEYDHDNIKRFMGIDRETAGEFWKKTLYGYFGTTDEEYIREIENKIRCVSYVRLIDWGARHLELDSEVGRGSLELWKSELEKLVPEIDSLDFGTPKASKKRNEIEIDALVENLDKVQEFIGRNLDGIDCSPKTRMHIDIAAEEIFVNIASYAYKPDTGKTLVRVDVEEDPVTVEITFIDQGKPYDPLAKEDPDVAMGADERSEGGLGIFMTKQTMDDISYEYKEGRNILRMKKNI